MLCRAFSYAHKLPFAGVYRYESYWSIEGSVGIIDIFDQYGAPSVCKEVWDWAEQLKKRDKTSGRT